MKKETEMETKLEKLQTRYALKMWELRQLKKEVKDLTHEILKMLTEK